ncbi:MAG: XTP/dITP diphosphatase [Geobacteraceae bacterium]|nr:XTP/dITP diphosphatase [Geobacteraceae bacterium]
MKQMVVATRNRGKLKELEAMLGDLVDEFHCAADLDGFPDTVEDGVTFEDNALKKAREASGFTGLPALADDSGLVVDALDGRPGVFSARFAGEGAGDDANNLHLLEELRNVSAGERRAAFVCVLAFVTPDGFEKTFTGRIGGQILESPRGNGGFGYDPLFLVDGFDCSMAELELEQKNAVSHRGQAFRQFREYLEQV